MTERNQSAFFLLHNSQTYVFMICAIQPVIGIPIGITWGEANKNFEIKEKHFYQLTKIKKNNQLTFNGFRQQCAYHDVAFHIRWPLYSKVPNLNENLELILSITFWPKLTTRKSSFSEDSHSIAL
jgi:hypothetical protein